MSKLDWAKAKLRPADPGRVADVGDYGILSDRLAGRKGNVRPKRIKKGPSDSDTVAKSAKPNHAGRPSDKKGKNRKSARQDAGRGAGLTIPEKIVRARRNVEQLEKEIIDIERKLSSLRKQLGAAELELQRTRDLPRRSPTGQARHEAAARKC